MRLTNYLMVLNCICLATACTSAPQPASAITPTMAVTPTARPFTPTAGTPPAPATPDYKSDGESLLSNIPQCAGMEVQENPITFSWPNLEQITGATWGYYSCDQPQAAVAAFYRSQLPGEPYNYMEVNWVERAQGVVGVYYVLVSTYLYVWMIPQPDNPQRSYVIVALSSEAVDC
jgi:hypothetical protein